MPAITDAREATRLAFGRALSPGEWIRNPLIRQLAKQRGLQIKPPQFVAAEAPPALAFLNHGAWKAWCPDCLGQAEDLWRSDPIFMCMGCGNARIGGAWRPVLFPKNRAEIEAQLEPLLTSAQHWEPASEDSDD